MLVLTAPVDEVLAVVVSEATVDLVKALAAPADLAQVLAVKVALDRLQYIYSRRPRSSILASSSLATAASADLVATAVTADSVELEVLEAQIAPTRLVGVETVVTVAQAGAEEAVREDLAVRATAYGKRTYQERLLPHPYWLTRRLGRLPTQEVVGSVG